MLPLREPGAFAKAKPSRNDLADGASLIFRKSLDVRDPISGGWPEAAISQTRDARASTRNLYRAKSA
jgi:hypothetical protein